MAAIESLVGGDSGSQKEPLEAILNPERLKSWEGAHLAIEQLDDLIRRYEARTGKEKV